MWRGVYTEFDDDKKTRGKWLRGRSGDRRSRDELDGGNETAGAAAAFFEKKDRFLSGVIGGFFWRGEFAGRVAEKIDGGFGHDYFHDGFAETGAGDAANGDVGVTTA